MTSMQPDGIWFDEQLAALRAARRAGDAETIARTLHLIEREGSADHRRIAETFGRLVAEGGEHVIDIDGPDMCDFCGDPARWFYPHTTFEIDAGNLRQIFEGPWYACQPCHVYADTGQWRALRERVGQLDNVYARAAWLAMSGNRTGPAVLMLD